MKRARPSIPVRDGLRFGPRPKFLPSRQPDFGEAEFVAGWRWGFVCGMMLATLLVTLVATYIIEAGV